MLDEFDVPNVEEIILDCGEPENIASWERIKKEIVIDKVEPIIDCPHRWKPIVGDTQYKGIDWCYWCGSVRITRNDGKEVIMNSSIMSQG